MRDTAGALGRRVVYDHQIFSAQPFGGISRYFTELAGSLAECSEWTPEILAPAHINAYVSELDAGLVTGLRVPRVPKSAWLRKLLNDRFSRFLLNQRPPALLHETYYSRTGLGPPGVPRVLTVYDMVYETFPEHFPDAARHSLNKVASVRRAEHVICISESTRDDLLRSVPLEPERVSVVHLASSLERPTEDAAPIALLDHRDYLLYVGQRGTYKNFDGLLLALAAHPEILSGRVLALYGGGALSDQEIARIRQLGIPLDAIVHVGNDEAILGRLYKHARVFVYPSRYEGFGIPILESMSCSCPVVCGTGSSLREVAADAVEYCDVSDPESLAVSALRVLNSNEYANRLRDLGNRRRLHFSWTKCASETAAIYDRIVERYSTATSAKPRRMTTPT